MKRFERSHKMGIGVSLRAAFLFLAVMLFALDVSAQSTISGKVVDTNGEEIISATVLVKGSQGGSVSDFDGNFKVQCEPGATLVISYIGYLTQEVTAQNGMVVTLKEDNALLDEVVVIGYGSVKKADATGSVMTFQADPKLKGVATNPQDMLVGKMAGVTVTTSGGASTDGASIRIRGGSSLSASNDPLIILDGVYLDNTGTSGISNIMSTINPNDIESFTVLKDASATAIYGSRASNGVIIITTKKGVSGKVKVSYDGSVTVATRRKDIKVFSGDEYRNLIQDIFMGDSRYDEVMSKLGNENTDWQKELFRTSVSTDHNIQAMGSVTDWLPFRVSLGYTNNNGILKTDHMHRYTGSVNLSPSFFDGHLKINLNGRGMFIKNNFADRSVIKTAVSMNPTVPVMDPNSQYGGYWSWTDAEGNMLGFCDKNPVAGLFMHHDYSHAWNVIGSAQVEYNAFYVPGLKANLNLSIDGTHSWGENSQDYNAPQAYQNLGNKTTYASSKKNSLLDFYVTYNRDLKEIKSHFDVMAGYSWQHYYSNGHSTGYGQYMTDQPYNRLTDIDPATLYPVEAQINENPEWKTEHYIVSFFGRLNYSFNDKYLLTFTLRNDGSSRFGKDNRWGLFPSLALGWRIIQEKFMQNQNVLSNLKLRLGWGKTGQQDINMGDYPYMGTYSLSTNGQSQYWRNGGWQQLLKPNAYNPNLKWETTTTWNVGLDYGFVDNRINGSIDWYYRKTTDLINAEAKVPAGTNFAEFVVDNIGSLRNTGVEFTINTIPVQTKNFTWEISGNLAYNSNKILELTNSGASTDFRRFGSTGYDGAFQNMVHYVGQPANMFYVFEQVYDEAGRPIEGLFVDQNNDGVLDDNDLRPYHTADPNFTYGVNTKIQYKSWDFSIAGHGAANNWVYNGIAANNSEVGPSSIYANQYLRNRVTDALNTRWDMKKVLSDYYVQNASYFRIDNITLGYSFKKFFGTGLSGRTYLVCQNPFVFTAYDGLDPEIAGGVDLDVYPRPVSFQFGINLNF